MGAAVSKAEIVRGIQAMDATGHKVVCLRMCANGDALLLTTIPEDALPAANDPDEWVNLAGETDLPRAEGA